MTPLKNTPVSYRLSDYFRSVLAPPAARAAKGCGDAGKNVIGSSGVRAVGLWRAEYQRVELHHRGRFGSRSRSSLDRTKGPWLWGGRAGGCPAENRSRTRLSGGGSPRSMQAGSRRVRCRVGPHCDVVQERPIPANPSLGRRFEASVARAGRLLHPESVCGKLLNEQAFPVATDVDRLIDYGIFGVGCAPNLFNGVGRQVDQP